MKIPLQHKILVSLVLFVLGCQTAPKVQAPAIPASEVPPPVIATPVQIEKLVDLQNAVYELEDRIYGSRKLKDLGVYGELKSCRRKLASPQYGGQGTMIWSEALDRVTDKEADFKAAGFRGDAGARFLVYRTILEARSDQFQADLKACQAELSTRPMNADLPNRVMVTDAPKASVERNDIHRYLCGYVKPGASLSEFIRRAFAKGWLAVSDYALGQNLVGVLLKDAKGRERDNALLFNGWKLAFDRGVLTVGDVLNGTKDAQLVAWTKDHKVDVADSSTCLPAADGQWNP